MIKLEMSRAIWDEYRLRKQRMTWSGITAVLSVPIIGLLFALICELLFAKDETVKIAWTLLTFPACGILFAINVWRQYQLFTFRCPGCDGYFAYHPLKLVYPLDRCKHCGMKEGASS